MNIFEKNFNVEICDIDTKNALTNYGILRMMQESAAIHSDKIGISINHINEKPYTWLLLGWKLEVFRRPGWNTELKIKTWPSSADKLYTYRDFEVFNSNNEIIAKARSKWVLINVFSHTIEKTSQEILDMYKPSFTNVFGSEINRLNEPNSYSLVSDYKVLKTDLDLNGHVNNLSFLKIAFNVLPDEIYNMEFNKLDIMYKNQCKYGENVKCFYSEENNVHTITIKSEDLTKLHCIIRLEN